MDDAPTSTWERMRRRTWFWFGVVQLAAILFWCWVLFTYRTSGPGPILGFALGAPVYLVIGVGFIRRSRGPLADPLES